MSKFVLRCCVFGLLCWGVLGGVNAGEARPALTVTVVQPHAAVWPLQAMATGNIEAWQEAVVGTEANNLRLIQVKANVGDRVKRGQVLAVFEGGLLEADVLEAQAVLAQLRAQLAEAVANTQRAQDLGQRGFISPQKVTEAVTVEAATRARVEAQSAVLQNRRLRLTQTTVLAPDDGVISARRATVGAVLPAGQELFRLIRQGRLEWRAEVAASVLASLKPGMSVKVVPVGGEPLLGRLRSIAPIVDPQTRNGLVYVDLPGHAGARAGMFARGEFSWGQQKALVVPQSAVLEREGFSYVMRLDSDARVTRVKVTVGRRLGDEVEVLSGLEPTASLVLSGGGFLADGDRVKVLNSPAAPTVR